MDYKKWSIVLAVNLALALGFFYEHRDAQVFEISSDLANIIPVCMKLDDPTLFTRDLYLSDVNDVKYYTPFFVQTLRGLAVITQGDYLQALNLLSFITHLIYGIGWFLLFYTLRRDFILALVFSVFFRGILWPPGGELLGISALWTMMPRTLYIALAPLPVLAYCWLPKWRILVSGLLLGLILNFHPISGLAFALCCFASFTAYWWFLNGKFSVDFYKEFFQLAGCFVLGMSPYLFTYLGNIKFDMAYTQALYEEAFVHRIDPFFTQPGVFIMRWLRPNMLVFGLAFGIFWFFDRSPRKRNFYIILFGIVTLFVVSNGFEYVQRLVNATFGKNIRMAFQLIRMQKYILVFLLVALYLLLWEISQKMHVSQRTKAILAGSFFLILSLSSHPVCAKLPLLGDDLITGIYPQTFKVFAKNDPSGRDRTRDMMNFIKQNTPKDALFYGSFFIRAGAGRSVALDGKGAGMLIEGDPNKFIRWYLETREFEKLDMPQQYEYLRRKGVDYLWTNEPVAELRLVKKSGNNYLYALQ